MKLWLRPGDISATLDAVEQQPLFEKHFKDGRIGTLWLSMAGNTTLALAGARIDRSRLASYCDTGAHNSSLCEGVGQSGINLHSMDMNLAVLNNLDARMRFAMAIDPAPVDAFQPDSFSAISIPLKS